MLLGINGKIGSGKDTVGSMIQYLTSECSNPNGKHFRTYQQFVVKSSQGNNDYQHWYESDWEIKKFAEKLKQVASLLTGIPRYKFEDQEFKKTNLGPEWNKKVFTGEWISGIPIDSDTQMSVRTLLQKLGTEALRQGLHTNTWVNALFSEYTPLIDDMPFVQSDMDMEYLRNTYPKWIITDMRFPNELQSVVGRGGITIRVTRPGTDVGNHPSETALDEYPMNYEIVNDGTLDELLVQVKDILKQLNIIQ